MCIINSYKSDNDGLMTEKIAKLHGWDKQYNTSEDNKNEKI